VDGFDRELRVFGPDGALLRRFGRRGGGPGEFESVAGMAVGRDGTAWIVDGASVRYTVIRGDEVRTHRRASALYRLPWLGGLGPDGYFHDAVVFPGGPGEVLLRIDREGAVTDTFAVPAPLLAVPRRGAMSFPIPYAPRVLRAFDPGGFVWIAVTHAYRAVKVSLRGDTVLVVERGHRPPALTGVERDSIRRYVRALEPLGVAVREEMLPRTGPLLRWLSVDDRANLWVGRAGTEGRPVADVFDAAGRHVAEVAVPFERVLLRPVVRGDEVYAVVAGEYGVPVVVRARVIRGRDGPERDGPSPLEARR